MSLSTKLLLYLECLLLLGILPHGFICLLLVSFPSEIILYIIVFCACTLETSLIQIGHSTILLTAVLMIRLLS